MRRGPLSLLALLWLCSPAAALSRGELLERYRELDGRRESLLAEGKKPEAEAALAELRGLFTAAAQEADAASPRALAELREALQLWAAAKVLGRRAADADRLDAKGLAALERSLSGAAERGIRGVALEALRRFPGGGSWGDYFLGKLKSFRALVEAAYEADLLDERARESLHEEARPINEGFFAGKLESELARIRAKPDDEASYRTLRGYLAALGEIESEFPSLAPFRPGFLKPRVDRLLALLAELNAPLESSLARADGNSYLRDKTAVELYEASPEAAKDPAPADYRARRGQCAELSADDAVGTAICRRFLIRAQLAFLKGYARWYDKVYARPRGASKADADKEGGAGKNDGIKVSGAELLDDPEIAKLAAGAARKSGEEAAKEKADFLERRLGEVRADAAKGDPSALERAKQARVFARELHPEMRLDAEIAEQRVNSTLFEAARGKRDLPALIQALRYQLAELGANAKEVAAMRKEFREAVLEEYQRAVDAEDLDAIVKLLALRDAGLAAAEYPLAPRQDPADGDIGRILARRYKAARKAGDLAEMRKAYVFGHTGLISAGAAVTQREYGQDAIAALGESLDAAAGARDAEGLRRAYAALSDPLLAHYPEAAAQRKRASRALSELGVSTMDGADLSDAPPEEPAARAEGGGSAGEKPGAWPAGCFRVEGHPGLAVEPPAGVRAKGTIVGYRETVNGEVQESWGKLSGDWRWSAQARLPQGTLAGSCDVVRSWFLDRPNDPLRAQAKSASDESLAAAKYESLELGPLIDRLAERQLERRRDAFVAETKEGPVSEAAASRASEDLRAELRKPERRAKAEALLREFLKKEDARVEARLAQTLSEHKREGNSVSLARYQEAVREAAGALLAVEPKGTPDLVGAAGDFSAKAASRLREARAEREERRRDTGSGGHGIPEKNWPAMEKLFASLRPKVGLDQASAWRAEYAAAVAELEKGGDLADYAGKAEAVMKGWEPLYRRAMKTYTEPVYDEGTVNVATGRRIKVKEGVIDSYMTLADGRQVPIWKEPEVWADEYKDMPAWCDLKRAACVLQEHGPPKREGWAHLPGQGIDPNAEVSEYLVTSLRVLRRREEGALKARAESLKTRAESLAAASRDLDRELNSLQSLRWAAKDAGGPSAEELGAPPKGESNEQRLSDLHGRLMSLRESARSAESRLAQLRDGRPQLDFAAKREAGSRADMKDEARELAREAEEIARLAKDGARAAEAVAEFKVHPALQPSWERAELAGGVKLGWEVKRLAEQERVGSGSGAPRAAPDGAGEPPGLDDPEALLAFIDKKEGSLSEFLLEEAPVRQRLEQRFEWERAFKGYADQYRAAIWDARSNPAAAQPALALLDKARADPIVGPRLDQPDYAAAKEELARLDREYSAARGAALGAAPAPVAQAAASACTVEELRKTVVAQFQSYERGDVGGFMDRVAPSFRGYDRFMLGLDRAMLLSSIADDLRNLSDIVFDVSVDAPIADREFGGFRVPMTWAIRARLGATKEEWIASAQRSTLRYYCRDSQGFLLAAIEGENIFGRSNYAGVTAIDRGTMDGAPITAPQAIVNGETSADTSLLVGFAGVAGTPNSTVGGAITLGAVSPATAFVGSQTALKITGEGFSAGGALKVEFAPGQVNACAFSVSNLSVVSATELQLTLTLDPDALGVGGTRQAAAVPLKVTNGNGAAATLSSAFTVEAPGIASVAPAVFLSTMSQALTITGTNLRAGFTYGLFSTDPQATVTGVVRVNDNTLTATLDGMCAEGDYSLFLYVTGAAPVCSPANGQGGVTLIGAGRVDYTINP